MRLYGNHSTGGPSGSGVDAILSFGKAMEKVLGSDYDLIGFDPRGKFPSNNLSY